MARLGINVPDELLKRMKPFKSSVNVSQVCRDALEAQVAAYERARARFDGDNLRDLIQRFSEEHVDREIDWETLGHEDAKVWMELASLKDLETVFYRLSFVGRPGMLERPTVGIVPFLEGTKLFEHRWQENEEAVLRLYDFDENTNHYLRAKEKYELGWFSYARVVWEQVQATIAKDKGNTPVLAEENGTTNNGDEGNVGER